MRTLESSIAKDAIAYFISGYRDLSHCIVICIVCSLSPNNSFDLRIYWGEKEDENNDDGIFYVVMVTLVIMIVVLGIEKQQQKHKDDINSYLSTIGLYREWY